MTRRNIVEQRQAVEEMRTLEQQLTASFTVECAAESRRVQRVGRTVGRHHDLARRRRQAFGIEREPHGAHDLAMGREVGRRRLALDDRLEGC